MLGVGLDPGDRLIQPLPCQGMEVMGVQGIARLGVHRSSGVIRRGEMGRSPAQSQQRPAFAASGNTSWPQWGQRLR